MVDATTGALLRKIDGVHSGGIFSVAWSPDGSRLYLGSADKTASVVDCCSWLTAVVPGRQCPRWIAAVLSVGAILGNRNEPVQFANLV